MKRKSKITFLIIFAIIISFILIERIFLAAEAMGDKVAIVEVKGIISSAEETISELQKHRDDRSVKAIVLRIDSPGGGVAPSQEIYRELQKLNKPTVASMENVAASGGYYIAMGTDYIFANPGTLTGSIGAIVRFANMKELYGKIGVEYETVKSGLYKDIGSTQRKLTAKERELLQETIDDVEAQFVAAILEGRRGILTAEEVKAIADGRIFSGKQALKLKLIDQLGGLQTAIGHAGKLGGIVGIPKILKLEQKSSLIERLLGIKDNVDRLLFHAPSFRYEL